MKQLCRALLFGTVLAVCISCGTKAPRIEAIDPRIGTQGEMLTIRGSGFRAERGESHVTIAGTAPTASSYIEWSDKKIAIRIPDFGESGLVYVTVNKKTSNPALYTNRSSVPVPVSENEEGIAPRIMTIEPAAAAIGTAITLNGRNFGSARENGSILFSWETDAARFIEASELEFCYELWSDREIRVRVPDGAASGTVAIKSARGLSEAVNFQVIDKPGTKTYKDKKTYVFSYSADFNINKSSQPNTLYVWMPVPVSTPFQHKIKPVTRTIEPFVEEHRGASLFQFKNVSQGEQKRITMSYIIETYAVETKINVAALKKEKASPIKSAYTLASPLIPSDDKEIIKAAERIAGKEKFTYLQAKKIFDWLITEAGIGKDTKSTSLVQAMTDKSLDSYTGALLFCALARARGIPALPVAGFLVDRNRSAYRHWWAEFWIDGFGWIPVDPACGAGVMPPGFTSPLNSPDYYFGNLDNQRIVFSRGFSELSPMDPRGRTVPKPRSYAFQSIWEEAVGGLDSYSSLWNDITVTGVY